MNIHSIKLGIGYVWLLLAALASVEASAAATVSLPVKSLEGDAALVALQFSGNTDAIGSFSASITFDARYIAADIGGVTPGEGLPADWSLVPAISPPQPNGMQTLQIFGFGPVLSAGDAEWARIPFTLSAGAPDSVAVVFSSLLVFDGSKTDISANLTPVDGVIRQTVDLILPW